MSVPDFVIEVGDKWCLKEDTNLTPQAQEKGTIQLETYVKEVAKDYVKSGSQVVDAGAFIGDTALDFQEMGAQVFAFEPQPDAFACLEHNCPEAKCYNAAVGDGTRVLCAPETLDGAGNLGTRQLDPSDRGAESLILDHVTFENLSFVKIDVEGFEYRAIKGMSMTLQDHAPTVLCEIFPAMMARYGDHPKRLYRFMEALGYSRKVVIGKETEPRYDVLFTK